MAGQTQTNKPPVEQSGAVDLSLVAGLARGNEGLTASLAELIEIQKRREAISLERLEREEEQRKNSEALEKEVRKQGAEAAAREIRIKAARQKGCRHRKPNGHPYTGAIYGWNNQFTVICGHCEMRWEGSKSALMQELGSLFPNEEAITGPIFGAGGV